MSNMCSINADGSMSDGIMIVYVKNGEIYPVVLKSESHHILDMMIPMAFPNGITLGSKPMGKAKQLKKEDL